MYTSKALLRRFVLRALLSAAALVVLPGCEDDDDYDHKPPAGMGTLILENETVGDISVAVDGIIQPKVRDDSNRKYDLQPGVRRLVLDQQGGDRAWRGDTDIIEGHLTIVSIRPHADPDRFDISVRFE